jgi:hypothetical protein
VAIPNALWYPINILQQKIHGALDNLKEGRKKDILNVMKMSFILILSNCQHLT